MTVDNGIAVTREVRVRYCEDCIWNAHAYCNHPKVAPENRVRREGHGSICSLERGDHGDCGPEGRFWQEKKLPITEVRRKFLWIRKLFDTYRKRARILDNVGRIPDE